MDEFLDAWDRWVTNNDELTGQAKMTLDSKSGFAFVVEHWQGGLSIFARPFQRSWRPQSKPLPFYL